MSLNDWLRFYLLIFARLVCESIREHIKVWFLFFVWDLSSHWKSLLVSIFKLLIKWSLSFISLFIRWKVLIKRNLLHQHLLYRKFRINFPPCLPATLNDEMVLYHPSKWPVSFIYEYNYELIDLNILDIF